MIILAFDFGTKKMGVAVGEQIIKKARALSVLSMKNGQPDWIIIKKLLKYWDPKIIIVGLPLNINGTKQNITQQSEIFACKIQHKFNIPVEMHDERFTTVEARSIIFKKGGFKALKKKRIDSTAAVIILESWLEKFS
ncbi:Holliday junction resolvase RuvX [Buchnera aphidicola]|uniref:Holliday junction resolvase RuvX n=1 Tax=Buchnera aphidicola TaxID=9 RepID=UPI0034645F18